LGDFFISRRNGLVAGLVAALACAPGCAYLGNRGRDALDMFDLGFTFTKKLQFGIYANCPFIAPGGYSKVDGKYVGLGGGKFGVMEHHQDAAALLLWGREDVGWDKKAPGRGKSSGSHQVGPLGLATDAEGNPTYKPQCAHYLHLGFVGATANLNYKEWGDFFLGWVGADISKDDNRETASTLTDKSLEDFSAHLSRPRAGLQLIVDTDKESYAEDEPIVLDVQLMNTTGVRRLRRDRPRDLSVYFEPFANTPQGEPAEWLFKFFLFDQIKGGDPLYKSPRFDVPPDNRGDYYHYVTLPPGAFVGRRFAFPAPGAGRWLQPGTYIFLVSYEVSHEYPYVILNREFTSRHTEALGRDGAYTRVWTGKVYSNIVSFRIERKRRFGIF